MEPAINSPAEPWLSPPRRVFWRGLQGAFFVIGTGILAALLLRPQLGLHLLWNVLIPVAPALLVLAPGLWRNVCPMGTASMLPSHAGLSRRKRISVKWQGRLFVGAVILLLLIVPLRHTMLDTSGLITGIVLLAVALLAMGLGAAFDGKSAWCSGLCPVYPVELLYGQRPVATVRNSHCRECTACVAPCADSRPAAAPQDAGRRGLARVTAAAFAGGFPGFIIGWYQVPTWQPAEGLHNLHIAYAWPLGGMAISLVLFLILWNAYPRLQRGIGLLFAATAVIAYYWFKLPVMLGLGDQSSALVPGLSLLPQWAIWPLRAGVIVLFGALLLRPARGAWTLRPPRHRTGAAGHA